MLKFENNYEKVLRKSKRFVSLGYNKTKQLKLRQMKGTKEFYELQASFEKYVMSRNCPIYFGCEIVRSPKDSKYFYENGKLNQFFIMYMAGYMTGRVEYMR